MLVNAPPKPQLAPPASPPILSSLPSIVSNWAFVKSPEIKLCYELTHGIDVWPYMINISAVILSAGSTAYRCRSFYKSL